MSVSVKQRLAAIGEPARLPLWLRGSFGLRTPRSLRVAIDGMTDPGVDQWYEVGVALSEENTDLSHEAQGITTDGTYWFVCSNNTKQVVSIDNAANHVATFSPAPAIRMQMWADAGHPDADTDDNGIVEFSDDFDPHFGPPSFHGGWIYVPIQSPRGVWRFSLNGGEQLWQMASSLPDGDLFPWCAIHPVTGMLYTCNFTEPLFLRAYDPTPTALVYSPGDDIRLGSSPIDLDKVQGGVFTAHGRLILVRSSFNAVFCFSSLNGHYFGAKMLGDFGSNFSEVEAVTIRSWQFDGVPAHVHIFELDNDYIPPDVDDFYLHSFRVLAPSLL
jgi:hypothetical protein